MKIPYYKDRVCINFLAGSVDNAKELYQVAEGHTVVGVLSTKFENLEIAEKELADYMEVLEGNVSVGLGAGNPNQWRFVGDIAGKVKAHHFNQVFTGVGYTRGKTDDDNIHINALVSPTGTPGVVKISTGPLSAGAEKEALVDVETAILMVKDMGGNALKFFPMGGLKAIDELKALADACAKHDFALEPTGGIDLDNYEEILKTILDAGVKKVIPHVYTSIIDPETGLTRPKDVATLLEITKKLLD